MSDQKKNRVPALVIAALENIVRYAECEKANFGGVNNATVTLNDRWRDYAAGDQVPLDQLVKEAIRNHHKTYIVDRLKEVLAWCKGEKSTREISWLGGRN